MTISPGIWETLDTWTFAGLSLTASPRGVVSVGLVRVAGDDSGAGVRQPVGAGERARADVAGLPRRGDDSGRGAGLLRAAPAPLRLPRRPLRPPAHARRQV